MSTDSRCLGLTAGRILLAMGVLTAPACSKKPQEPSPLPVFAGNYTLVVEASSVCRLSVAKFQWDVEATVTGTGQAEGVRVTLPGGDAAVDVGLSYSSSRSRSSSPPPPPSVNGRIVTRRAPFGEEQQVTIAGNAQATVDTGSGGRAQVTEGVLNGTIALSKATERANDALGSCTAADHRWTLTPH